MPEFLNTAQDDMTPMPPSETAQPQAPMGDITEASANVISVIHVLSKALSDLTPLTPQGKAVMSALKILTKEFGESKEKDLTGTQIKNMMGAMPDELRNSIQPQGGNIPPELLQAMQGGAGGAGGNVVPPELIQQLGQGGR